MKIKLLRNYRHKVTGNVVFVYEVTGSKADLVAYKEAQGENYVEEDETGKVLWFTTRCVGPVGKLIITSTGKLVPDMSEYEAAASLVAQFGGNFGQELAKASVAKLLGGNSGSSTTSTPRTEEANASDDSSLDQM